MFPVINEKDNPARRFTNQAEARQVAQQITNKPRSGIAKAQYTGAWDYWIVEVRPRAKPYSNPGVLRADGTIAKYH